MRLKMMLVAAASALALGACDRADENAPASSGASSAGTSSGATAPAAQPQASTPTTPANIGQPRSTEEKKEGANPVQGQVDPKHAEQHRDFQQRGDAAGPKSPETKPKTGG